MDPITVVATLIATKAIEKVGEKMGEGGLSLGGRVLGKLRGKAPDAVQKLEASAENAADPQVIQEIQQVVAADPVIRAEMDSLTQLVHQSGGVYINNGKAANVGTVITQNNTFV